MKKTIKLGELWRLLGVGLTLFFLGQSTAMAQTAVNQLKSLEIELWPEFDRPETLVIYHVELPTETALPAQVTFQLPGYLEKMHVVAVERNGGLVEMPPDAFELRLEGDQRLLTITASAPRLQFEYYDPAILKKEGSKRDLKFDFTASYAAEKFTFRVQEPGQAENFTTTPAASTSFSGTDGFKYHTIEIAGLAANEQITLAARYTKPTNELSAPVTVGANAEHAADLPAVSEPPANQNLTIGYTLIGIGVVLLLGVGGYWVWSKRIAPAAAARPRAGPKRKRVAKSVKVTAAVESASPAGKFCYRCGAALREDAGFCHVCGAERRKE